MTIYLPEHKNTPCVEQIPIQGVFFIYCWFLLGLFIAKSGH